MPPSYLFSVCFCVNLVLSLLLCVISSTVAWSWWHGFDVRGLWDVWVWRGSEFWLWVVMVWWWWMCGSWLWCWLCGSEFNFVSLMLAVWVGMWLCRSECSCVSLIFSIMSIFSSYPKLGVNKMTESFSSLFRLGYVSSIVC